MGTPGAGPRRVVQARDHAPFTIGKPFVRQPRGDIRVTPGDRRRAVAQRAAEVAERRVVFDANNTTEEARWYTGTLAHADPN